jgi:cytidine deaminase
MHDQPKPPRPRPEDGDVADLMRVAHAAAQLAYSPYSRVKVGAALLAEDGQVYTGCNVENASYGLTLCAERSAIVRAVSSGERRYRAIAIATDRPQALMPCGACRQFLLEFAPRVWVHVQGAHSAIETVNLAELLPRAFSPRDLPDSTGPGNLDLRG